MNKDWGKILKETFVSHLQVLPRNLSNLADRNQDHRKTDSNHAEMRNGYLPKRYPSSEHVPKILIRMGNIT